MLRKKSPGLFRRADIWHIDKQINGQRVRQSTGTDNPEDAERYLARLMEENRQAVVYVVRPQRSFEQAAAKYALEYQHKRSLDSDIGRLKSLMAWIGEMPLERIHTGTLQPWLNYRRDGGAKTGTINHGLKVVRRILNLAATEWFDEYGMTWLQAAAKIRLLADHSKQPPYPLGWDEQDALFKELPPTLRTWHCLQSILAATQTRSALCSGNGKLMYLR